MSCIGCVPATENEQQTPPKGVLGDEQVNMLYIYFLKFIAYYPSQCPSVLSFLGLLFLFLLPLWCFSASVSYYVEDSFD